MRTTMAFRRPSLSSATVVACLVVCLGTLWHQADADVLVTTSSSPPSSSFLSHPVPYGSFGTDWQWTPTSPFYPYEPAHVDRGQSFTISGTADVVLESITVRAFGSYVGTDVASSPFHFELWHVADGLDISGDTLITSQPGVMPDEAAFARNEFGGVTQAYWTFDFEDLLVQGDATYAFILAFDAEATNRYVSLISNYGEPVFAGGRKIERRDGEWTAASWDLDFYLQATVVPEPSTLVLLVMGAVTLLFLGRRGRKRG